MTFKEYLLAFVGKEGDYYEVDGTGITLLFDRTEAQHDQTAMIEAVYDDFVTIKQLKTRYHNIGPFLVAIPFSRLTIHSRPATWPRIRPDLR